MHTLNGFEVFPKKPFTTDWCIKQLEELFITFSVPYVLVSDNGKQFTSQQFESFLNSRAIIHKTSAPYRPVSNGQAEG